MPAGARAHPLNVGWFDAGKQVTRQGASRRAMRCIGQVAQRCRCAAFRHPKGRALSPADCVGLRLWWGTPLRTSRLGSRRKRAGQMIQHSKDALWYQVSNCSTLTCLLTGSARQPMNLSAGGLVGFQNRALCSAAWLAQLGRTITRWRRMYV